MKPDTFYDKAVYITIIIFIFSLVFNFIMGLGIFTSDTSGSGIQIDYDENGSAVVQGLSVSQDYASGVVMDNIWTIAIFGGIGAVALAIATQSTVVVGVYLFTITFWSAYVNLIDIFATGGFLTGSIWGIVVIGSACVILLFAAAVIGMLSGSG